jgi:fibrillarin-like pre-rRNA processing protein
MKIHRLGRNIFTENLTPGKDVYGEFLVQKKGKELRRWDPKRSKLAAAIKKGMKLKIAEEDKVLYLGTSSGTTPSHISDMIPRGMLYGVEFAPRVAREFILLSEERENLTPILASANKPEDYFFVPQVDLLYQDVAQPNQVDIFLKNLKFLKKGGLGFLAVKSRSIDVSENPNKIFKMVLKELKKHVEIIDKRNLAPFEKDHMAILVKKP